MNNNKIPKIKIPKIPRRERKFFGWSDDKWARGGGKHGYGRCYGAVRQGGSHADYRTRAEKLNDLERKENDSGDLTNDN